LWSGKGSCDRLPSYPQHATMPHYKWGYTSKTQNTGVGTCGESDT
jgi:hypothetical protein